MNITDGSKVSAILRCQDKGQADDIKFMFNPKELSIQLSVETSENPGARSQRSGRPKISFSHLPPKIITISNILFDTYETGEDVEDTYIQAFQKATQFIQDKERPPVYSFVWGKNYLEYCFVEAVNYKLTKFLADGKPVRAVIDSLTLKETEKPNDDKTSQTSSTPDAKNDNYKNRTKNR